MVLDIPGVPNLFEGRQEGEIFLAHRSGATSSTTPILSNGQLVFWERGSREYDDYNSAIDPGKWTDTEVGTGTVTETATYIQTASTINFGNTDESSAKLESNDLPTLTKMNELQFRCRLRCQNDLNSTPGTSAYLKAFGITLKSFSGTQFEDQEDDSVWLIVKNQDETWNIYKDGILDQSNQTATSNVITLYNYARSTEGGSGTRTATSNLYEFTIDGGVYLLGKSSNKNYSVLLTEHTTGA